MQPSRCNGAFEPQGSTFFIASAHFTQGQKTSAQAQTQTKAQIHFSDLDSRLRYNTQNQIQHQDSDSIFRLRSNTHLDSNAILRFNFHTQETQTSPKAQKPNQVSFGSDSRFRRRLRINSRPRLRLRLRPPHKPDGVGFYSPRSGQTRSGHMWVAICGLGKSHSLYSPALQLKPFIQEYLSDLGQLGGDFLDGDTG